MNQQLLDRLNKQVAAKSLLTHPFYQDWKEGKLSLDDLRIYAGQYYHFEESFPRFLSAVHSRCPDAQVRKIILGNLWDEEHGAPNHPALWLDFAAGLGMTNDEVESAHSHPNTQALLDSYTEICSSGSFQEGLAAIYAYEAQVPEIAVEKEAGLRDRYGVTDDSSLAFFNVHAEIDQEHSSAEAEAIGATTNSDDEAAVESALDASLDAWWGFLDGVNDLRGVAGAK